MRHMSLLEFGGVFLCDRICVIGKKEGLFRGIVAVLAVVSVANCMYLAVIPGETNANGKKIKEVMEMSDVERQMAFHIWLLDNYEGEPDIYDFYDQIKSGKDVLVCNSVAQAHSYIYGDNNSNDVTYCYIEEFSDFYENKEYDAILISDIYSVNENKLCDDGYLRYKPSYLAYSVWIKQ